MLAATLLAVLFVPTLYVIAQKLGTRAEARDYKGEHQLVPKPQ
jgi:hypothetical protein